MGHQCKFKKRSNETNIPSLSLAFPISIGLPMIESNNLLFPELSKLACHVASSSRREEMTAPMHWLSSGSLPPNSLSSSEDGPMLVFHLLSFVCHICWYWFARLEINVAVKGSRVSSFEAKAAIPQLLAQWIPRTRMREPFFFCGMCRRAC